MPTPRFLSEVAVLELFDPTYEVAVLAEWERRGGDRFAEVDTDLAQLLPTFGAAHLFIDDYDLNGESVDFCPQSTITTCWLNGRKIGDLDWFGVCEARSGTCQPTVLGQQSFLANQSRYDFACNSTFGDACGGKCVAQNTCIYDL